jgi:hypothetical protein
MYCFRVSVSIIVLRFCTNEHLRSASYLLVRQTQGQAVAALLWSEDAALQTAGSHRKSNVGRQTPVGDVDPHLAASDWCQAPKQRLLTEHNS